MAFRFNQLVEKYLNSNLDPSMESELYREMHACLESTHLISLRINTLTDKFWIIRVNTDMSCLAIKMILWETAQIPILNQRLIFGGCDRGPRMRARDMIDQVKISQIRSLQDQPITPASDVKRHLALDVILILKIKIVSYPVEDLDAYVKKFYLSGKRAYLLPPTSTGILPFEITSMNLLFLQGYKPYVQEGTRLYDIEMRENQLAAQIIREIVMIEKERIRMMNIKDTYYEFDKFKKDSILEQNKKLLYPLISAMLYAEHQNSLYKTFLPPRPVPEIPLQMDLIHGTTIPWIEFANVTRLIDTTETDIHIVFNTKLMDVERLMEIIQQFPTRDYSDLELYSNHILDRWKKCMYYLVYHFEEDAVNSRRVLYLLDWLIEHKMKYLIESLPPKKRKRFDQTVSLLEAVPDGCKPEVAFLICMGIFCSYEKPSKIITLLNWVPSDNSSCGDGSLDYMLIQTGNAFQKIFGISFVLSDEERQDHIDVKKWIMIQLYEDVDDWVGEKWSEKKNKLRHVDVGYELFTPLEKKQAMLEFLISRLRDIPITKDRLTLAFENEYEKGCDFDVTATGLGKHGFLRDYLGNPLNI